MPVPDSGGGLGACASHPHEEDVSVIKQFFFAHYMYGNGLVEFVVFWGGLGCSGVVWGLVVWCFNGPHDCYANRSNSQTSLYIGSPIDSRTVLPRTIG